MSLLPSWPLTFGLFQTVWAQAKEKKPELPACVASQRIFSFMARHFTSRTSAVYLKGNGYQASAQRHCVIVGQLHLSVLIVSTWRKTFRLSLLTIAVDKILESPEGAGLSGSVWLLLVSLQHLVHVRILDAAQRPGADTHAHTHTRTHTHKIV